VSDNFTQPATFAAVPIGGQFIEVMTTCDEVATRIEPTTYRGKPVNARRSGGKLIFIEDWEPAFVEVHRPDLGGN
jgi:hypothetical protein